MLNKLTLWFIPPKYKSSEDELRKARYFVIACLFTSGFSFFYLILAVVLDMEAAIWAMLHDTILIGILPLLLRWGLRIQIAGNLFILFGTIGVTISVFFTGGFESAIIFWYGVLPIASLLLVNKTSSYFWTFVCSLIVSFIAYLQIKGYPFENQIDQAIIHQYNLSTIIGVVLMLFLIALVFENTKQGAFKKLHIKNKQLLLEKERSDKLLLNILPEKVAEELKATGISEARDFENVTVLFTDFKSFIEIAELLSAKDLVHEIDSCFQEFDAIIDSYKIEKIKTIGDSYMAAAGLHFPVTSQPEDVVHAALEMQKSMQKRKEKRIKAGLPYFSMRVGIHTGSVVAGIVGAKKFQYDIWGDTVNTASRMESHGEINKVNISTETYELIKGCPSFNFESRGNLEVKGKGLMEMWFVSMA